MSRARISGVMWLLLGSSTCPLEVVCEMLENQIRQQNQKRPVPQIAGLVWNGEGRTQIVSRLSLVLLVRVLIYRSEQAIN